MLRVVMEGWFASLSFVADAMGAEVVAGGWEAVVLEGLYSRYS